MMIEHFEVAPGEPFEIEGVTVSIDQDGFGWELMGDEPVDVISEDKFGHNRIIHAGGANVPDAAMIKMIYDNEWQAIVEHLAYDSDERAVGVIVYPDWHDHAVTFKTWHNAAKGMLRRADINLDDIQVEAISPEYHQTSDTFYVVWSQSQFENYGGKGSKVSTDYYQSILSGDVWGITVHDDDDLIGEDSCRGFVGEYWSDHIQNEAREMLERVLTAKREFIAETTAQNIMNARPDLHNLSATVENKETR